MDLTKNIGTSKKQFDAAKTKSFVEVGKLKDGVAHHRVITGPALVETIWFPTLVNNNETGLVEQSMRTIIRPPDGCVLDKIIELDEQLTKRSMIESGNYAEDEIKKFRSSLRPSRSFRFLVFDRVADNDGPATVRVFDYPWAVKDQLESLQNTKNRKHPGYLEFGLAFMYDVYIERTKDPAKKNPKYATTYKTMPVTDSLPTVLLKQMIPVSWCDYDPESGQECPYKYEDYFTEQELVAISEYPESLATLAKVDSAEDIEQKLEKYPLYLGGLFVFGPDKGKPMFPLLNAPEIQEQLMAEYPQLLTAGEGVAQVAASAPASANAKPISIRSRLAEHVEEVQATVVEDEVVVDTVVEDEVAVDTVVEDEIVEVEPTEAVATVSKPAPPKPVATAPKPVPPKSVATAPKPVATAPKPVATAPKPAPPKSVTPIAPQPTQAPAAGRKLWR
jgi:hypothetical protein